MYYHKTSAIPSDSEPQDTQQCLKPLKLLSDIRHVTLLILYEKMRHDVCVASWFSKQGIGEPPRNTSQLIRERRIRGQLAQLE